MASQRVEEEEALFTAADKNVGRRCWNGESNMRDARNDDALDFIGCGPTQGLRSECTLARSLVEALWLLEIPSLPYITFYFLKRRKGHSQVAGNGHRLTSFGIDKFAVVSTSY